jgi:hypothetical protein
MPRAGGPRSASEHSKEFCAFPVQHIEIVETILYIPCDLRLSVLISTGRQTWCYQKAPGGGMRWVIRSSSYRAMTKRDD